MDWQKLITIDWKKIDNNHPDYSKMALLFYKIIPGATQDRQSSSALYFISVFWGLKQILGNRPFIVVLTHASRKLFLLSHVNIYGSKVITAMQLYYISFWPTLISILVFVS